MAWWTRQDKRFVLRRLRHLSSITNDIANELISQRILSTAINRKLDKLMTASESIQSEVNDLNSAMAVIATGTETLTSNLTAARAEIKKLRGLGVSEDVVVNLTNAVDGAQLIASKFAAAADPEQETPPVTDLPNPVNPTPSADGPESVRPDDSTGTPDSGTDTGSTDSGSSDSGASSDS